MSTDLDKARAAMAGWPRIIEKPDGWYIETPTAQAGPTTQEKAEQVLAEVEAALREFDGEKAQ